MKTYSILQGWQFLIDKQSESIESEFILLKDINILPEFRFPFKVDMSIAVICLKGSVKGVVDMNSYEIEAPYFHVILLGQILQYGEVSDDFEGLFIIMSKHFSDNIFPHNIKERLPLYLSVKNNPIVKLSDNERDLMKTYFDMLHKVVSQKSNPNRTEIVKHLMLAFFYTSGSQLHQLDKADKKTKQELLFERFIALVQTYFKQERRVIFYADKLCLTSKHLSAVIEQTSGKSVSKWIDEYVLLEAKALLKSTNMTIQQISDELNFPSQSFFGKYFKRLTGESPKGYRNG